MPIFGTTPTGIGSQQHSGFEAPENIIANIFQSMLSVFGFGQTSKSCTSADDSGDLVNDRNSRRTSTFDSENPPPLLLATTIVVSYVIITYLGRIWGPTVPPANDADPDDHDDDSSSNSSSDIISSTTGEGASGGLETVVQDVEIGPFSLSGVRPDYF